MGTNSSQIREELSQVLLQNTFNEHRADQLLSVRKLATSGRRRRWKQRQRRKEQRPYHRKSNAFEDEVLNAVLMVAYDLEMMTPKERWEQEQLKELEGMIDFPF